MQYSFMARRAPEPTPFVNVRHTLDGQVRSSVVHVPPELQLLHADVVRATIEHLQTKLLPDDHVQWTTGYLVAGKSNALTRMVRRTWRRVRADRWPKAD